MTATNESIALPPVAPRKPHKTTIHDETRTDDFYWLREKDGTEVLAYLHAENAYTDAQTAHLKPLEEKLYTEMLGRIQETDLSVPYRTGDGWLYYVRTEEGRQYPIYCRKSAAAVGDAPEEIILDLNELAEGEKFFSLGAFDVSDDGHLLAYSTDITGFRQYTLHGRDLRTGESLTTRIERVVDVAWASDSATLFYSTEDETTKRTDRVFRYHLRDSTNDGVQIYYEPDALYRAFLYRSRSKSLVFVGSASATATELSFVRSDVPTEPLTKIRAREAEHEYYADERGGLLYIRTNSDGATNFRIVSAPIARPSDWTEIVPHDIGVALEDHDCFARHLIISERVGGLPRLRIRDLETSDEHAVVFLEQSYALSGETNRVFDTSLFRFRYQSPVTPASVYDYNMETRERVLLKETPVPGGYDRTRYVVERLHATAKDGVTQIPITLIRLWDVTTPAPLLLYGYGSYGIPMNAGFNSNRFSVLDRGAVFAIAHIRGGGEMGKPWHDAGKMEHKQNTFDDFIACAEHLIAQKHTTSKQLAIMGGSAGGLLVGAVVNQRPELFGAVVSMVPFVDVLNTMLDDTLPLTIGEYLEWGNPNEPEAYATMRAYCPYTNLEAKAYPTMLVRTSYNDSQVMYWEPAKYVARLRTLKTDANPLLFRCNMDAGHGGASGRYDALKEAAQDYAFFLDVWRLANDATVS